MLARGWLLANIAPGSIVMQESYGALLANTPFEAHEEPTLAGRGDPCAFRADGVDYLVATSSMYERYYREPDRYVSEILFYERLKERHPLIYEVLPNNTTGGPAIRVYDIRGCDDPG
jgi:hypothetical protein